MRMAGAPFGLLDCVELRFIYRAVISVSSVVQALNAGGYPKRKVHPLRSAPDDMLFTTIELLP